MDLERQEVDEFEPPIFGVDADAADFESCP